MVSVDDDHAAGELPLAVDLHKIVLVDADAEGGARGRGTDREEWSIVTFSRRRRGPR